MDPSPFLASLGVISLAELGGKTQLAALSLATQYRAPVQVWLGASVGMALADCAGLAVGAEAEIRLPRGAVHVASGLAFLGFGLWTLAALATGAG